MQPSNELIVFVEDDVSEAEIFRGLIRKLGVNSFVRLYQSGAEALRSIASGADSEFPVSLYVLDINLPDISGTELCKAILAMPTSHRPRIAFLSHMPTREAIKLCEENPQIALLKKPSRISEYKDVIKEILALANPPGVKETTMENGNLLARS